jgi:hypothetical protein
MIKRARFDMTVVSIDRELTESTVECVSYPFQSMSISALKYRHNVEATIGEKRRMALQVVFGARRYARLLSGIDAFRAASEIGAITQANFDKDDGGSFPHYQINFTVPTTIISRYQPEPLIE